MNALAETLATALCLSALASLGLPLLRRAPPRLRFAIAVAGLAAWVVPWGAIRIALPSSSAVPTPLLQWLGAAEALVPAGPRGDAAAAFGALVAAAFLVGIALFVRDCLALARRVRSWRARSRPGDELRALLPRELAAVAAEIRIVEGSAVAATSGVLKPTIWLGDRYTGAQRTLALAHEMWHVRARDPVRLILIAAVRRAYWWNPLVAYLARQAVLMIESTCDHRCAAQFGKVDYITELASLRLAATAPASHLLATLGAANLDVQRLRLLGEPLRVRTRDLAVVAALATAGVATAAGAVIERTPTESDPLFAPPATPAGAALATLVRAANGGDSALLAELLGAYTPQELPLPLPRAANVRVVDVLRSEPLRIEYVVENESGERHVGTLAVAAAATTALAATGLRRLP